ncbi:hypothetical protein LTR96_011679 [Exophiala xenobiotica]|nr:hypothetical protein LTR96_011679 [Exophiala xenobiotica]KAK5332185.1 hypothetical protein LTR98_011675 [Exophiala xenobiotica]
MSDFNPFRDILQSEAWQSPEVLQVLDTNGPWTTSVELIDTPHETPHDTPHGTPRETPDDTQRLPVSGEQRQAQLSSLALLKFNEWDPKKTYDEDPPTCLRYTAVWKVTVNHKMISKDTEQNLPVELAAYWEFLLLPKLEKLLRQKVAANRCVRSDDTNIVVSVREREVRDLIKRFDGTEIDWSVMEKQLASWSKYFRAAKGLRVDLSFNYVEVAQRSAGIRPKEGANEVAWPQCQLGPYCWQDPIRNKHFKLYTHHLQDLVRHVQRGGTLHCHGDVPHNIRQQLYAEEQQTTKRRRTDTAMTPVGMTPINITNVLPGRSEQATPPITQIGPTPSIPASRQTRKAALMFQAFVMTH